jgi:hypothetical protein
MWKLTLGYGSNLHNLKDILQLVKVIFMDKNYFTSLSLLTYLDIATLSLCSITLWQYS